MNNRLARIDDVAGHLQQHFGDAPSVAVVLGSGLGDICARLEGAQVRERSALGLLPTGVPGHAGTVVRATLDGRPILMFSGRLHLYEGHPVDEVVLGARAIARWGVKTLVLTSAVGNLRREWPIGQPVRIRDHINFSGVNPLVGPNLPPGTRFPDLGTLYSPRLRSLFPEWPEAVYGAMSGPSYETPAEIRMLATVGADVVGMSMVHEAIAAHHHGLEVLGIGVLSNLAAGLGTEALTHTEVAENTAHAVEHVYQGLRKVVAAC